MDDGMSQAKQPVSSVLAGPYGHPFHPILVTVPIGAWVASLVFDVASYVADRPASFVDGAKWLVALGVVGALAAAMVGFLDFFGIPPGTSTRRTAVVHLSINLTLVAAYAVNFAWRQGLDVADDAHTPAGPTALSVVSVLLLAVSGYLGGKLAYHYGVRVADEGTQAEGYRTTTPHQ